MKQNVCGVDRAVRLLVGVALLAYALRARGSNVDRSVSPAQVLAGYGAAEFLLINTTLQWCPLNEALGIDTCVRDWPGILRDALGGREAELGADVAADLPGR